jgi:hypothetical protein
VVLEVPLGHGGRATQGELYVRLLVEGRQDDRQPPPLPA